MRSSELDATRAEIGRQAEQLAAVTAEIERLRSELRTQGEAKTAAEHRAETSATVRRELEYRIEELGKLLDREQKARTKAEADAQSVREDRATLSGKLDAAESRAEKAEKEAAQARREAESARVAEQAAQARLEREIEQLRQDRAAPEERARKRRNCGGGWQLLRVRARRSRSLRGESGNRRMRAERAVGGMQKGPPGLPGRPFR